MDQNDTPKNRRCYAWRMRTMRHEDMARGMISIDGLSIVPRDVCGPRSLAVPTSEMAKELRAIPTVGGFDENEWFLFVELISRTGMRLSECAGLLVKDIHLDDSVPWMAWCGWRNVPRSLPIPSACIDMMRVQLEGALGRRHLFMTIGLQHTTVHGYVQNVYGKKYSMAWVPLAKKVWQQMDVHMWRVYCAMQVIARYDSETASRLLGHRGRSEFWNGTLDIERLKGVVDSIE